MVNFKRSNSECWLMLTGLFFQQPGNYHTREIKMEFQEKQHLVTISNSHGQFKMNKQTKKKKKNREGNVETIVFFILTDYELTALFYNF